MKKFSLMFVVLSVVLLLIVACGQQAAPVVETVIVEKEGETVVETVVVEKEVEVVVEKEVEVEVTRIVEVEKEAEAEAPADDPSRELNIFAVQHAECSWDSFWCTVQAGIEQGAIDNNVDVTILAPDEFDLDKTVSMSITFWPWPTTIRSFATLKKWALIVRARSRLTTLQI